MRALVSATAILGIIMCPLVGQAKDDQQPDVMKASSSWFLDYAADSCNLSRKFGTGDETVVLTLTKMGPDDAFGLLLSGKQLKPVMGNDMRIEFGTEGETEAPYLTGTGDDGTVVLTISVAPLVPFPETDKSDEPDNFQEISAERANSIETLAFRKGLKNELVLKIGPMGAAVTAMQTCTDELLTHWGVDAAAHAKLTRKLEPTRSPANWIKISDYPQDMLRKGYSAIINFRLSVDAAGKPTQCHVQRAVGDDVFAAKSCQLLMARARFKPALDENGQPIASYFRSTVSFFT